MITGNEEGEIIGRRGLKMSVRASLVLGGATQMASGSISKSHQHASKVLGKVSKGFLLYSFFAEGAERLLRKFTPRNPFSRPDAGIALAEDAIEVNEAVMAQIHTSYTGTLSEETYMNPKRLAQFRENYPLSDAKDKRFYDLNDPVQDEIKGNRKVWLKLQGEQLRSYLSNVRIGNCGECAHVAAMYMADKGYSVGVADFGTIYPLYDHSITAVYESSGNVQLYIDSWAGIIVSPSDALNVYGVSLEDVSAHRLNL